MPGTSPEDLADLLAIRNADPDGQATEPTEKDYAQFKAWVIKTYGQAMWDRYNGNWDEGSTE